MAMKSKVSQAKKYSRECQKADVIVENRATDTSKELLHMGSALPCQSWKDTQYQCDNLVENMIRDEKSL